MSNSNCYVSHDCAPLIVEDVYHPALHISLRLTDKCLPNFPKNQLNKRYNFRKADYLDLYNELQFVDWSFMFYEVIYSVIDAHVPQYFIKTSTYPKWFTTEIINNIKLKSKNFKKYP
ncbi:hypothetical protein RI129_001224 [Pyrocoelia pectoralis]|uniref:Uncharacterized protein n=1 Tax=Pyrocoelia pectoralis TaxID=417401 RepID=A0AAN7ZJU2_9COLE